MACVRPLVRLLSVLSVAFVSAVLVASPARDTWDYTALGDSVATGYLAQQGYVSRYVEMVQADAVVDVALYNLAQNGRTSTQLLASFQDSRKGVSVVRTAVETSDVVTWNIGLNDFRLARQSYKIGKCGGGDNQSCLRSALATFKNNWNGIITAVLSARNLSNTIVRTMDIYNPWVAIDGAQNTTPDAKEPAGVRGNDLQVIGYYLAEANLHIATTCAASLLPLAQVALAFNGPSGTEDPASQGYLAADGLHPSDMGHLVIATQLRQLGYAPLR